MRSTPRRSRQQLTGVLSRSQIRELEITLATNPTVGDVIRGTGGVRKVRVALSGRGKRGGVRVIYFAHQVRERVYLFFLYAKNDQSDLTADQKKAVRRAVETIKAEG
ncbi:MAG TPA: type II toxin-antitoxin system RelE/ParE family toxin [Gemmatimonadales bacterium]|nr:type II toxin-antitoxin system RelE/ParE family toxin [Gemmatimonadales bacterium]